MHFLKRLIPWRIVRVDAALRRDHESVEAFARLMHDELSSSSDWRHFSKSYVGDQIYRYATCVRKALDDGNAYHVRLTATELANCALIAASNWGDLHG